MTLIKAMLRDTSSKNSIFSPYKNQERFPPCLPPKSHEKSTLSYQTLPVSGSAAFWNEVQTAGQKRKDSVSPAYDTVAFPLPSSPQLHPHQRGQKATAAKHSARLNKAATKAQGTNAGKSDWPNWVTRWLAWGSNVQPSPKYMVWSGCVA